MPVYQNVDAKPHTDPEEIKANLIKQLTAPVRWTQDVEAMIADGADEFIELGPGSVLQGLVKKINRGVALRQAVITTQKGDTHYERSNSRRQWRSRSGASQSA